MLASAGLEPHPPTCAYQPNTETPPQSLRPDGPPGRHRWLWHLPEGCLVRLRQVGSAQVTVRETGRRSRRQLRQVTRSGSSVVSPSCPHFGPEPVSRCTRADMSPQYRQHRYDRCGCDRPLCVLFPPMSQHPLAINVHDLNDALVTLREARERKLRHSVILRKRGQAKILNVTQRRAEAEVEHLDRVIARFDATLKLINSLTDPPPPPPAKPSSRTAASASSLSGRASRRAQART